MPNWANSEYRNHSSDLAGNCWLACQSARVRYAFLLAGGPASAQAGQLLDEAMRLAHEQLQKGNESVRVPVEIAAIHAARNQPNEALDWLEHAYQIGFRDRALSRDPIFKRLQAQPRFQVLVKRIQTNISEMTLRTKVAETLPVPPQARPAATR